MRGKYEIAVQGTDFKEVDQYVIEFNVRQGESYRIVKG